MTAVVIPFRKPAKRARAQRKRARNPAVSPRAALLATLRAESRARQWSGYSMTENTPLIELARAAAYSTKRSITWRGIRFPLRHSLFLTVLDPDTKLPLISTHGGVF